MKVPLFKVFMAPKEELDSDLLSIIHSGYITQGPKVEEFEAALRAFFANDRVVTLNSATSGLHLALHLLKRANKTIAWPGLTQQVDEVLTCPLTCTATNWPILANGLRIKWVDADPATCNVCIADLERKLSPTTKVIMLVHWGGTPVDLAAVNHVRDVCFKKFGFRPQVIEDCAHAFGATYDGLPLGSHGNMCVFSLQAIKHVTAVDGGVLITPDDALFARAKLTRWFGIDREKRSGGGDFRMEPDVAEFGFKFHLNDVNATIGLANLRHAQRLIDACRANAAHYDAELAGLKGVLLLRQPVAGVSAHWLYTFRITADARPGFISFMRDRGVTVSAVHQRNDVHSCVGQFKAFLPQLNQLADEIICVPVGWWVGEAERAHVISAIKEFSQSLTTSPLPSLTNPPQRRKCVITGGCGFIGHHVVEHFVKTTDYEIIVLDKLSYASKGYDRLRDSGVFSQIQAYCVDLCSPIPAGLVYEIGENVEVILHLAAETHVDNSISDPVPFVMNNVRSTLNLLEYARRLPQLKTLIYFSTDEVFGSAEDGQDFKEDDAHRPSNPYSASKSAAEMICHSYFNTYRLPIITMNVMNAFGERQHPEKFIPLCINKIINGEKITIHSYKGSSRAGSRFYIHARNIAAAVLFVLQGGEIGQSYNVRGEAEVDNLEIAQFIANVLGRELDYELHDAPHTRPGHDLRYALDGQKLEDAGWKLPLTFEDSLRNVVRWTVQNPRWLAGDSYKDSSKGADAQLATAPATAAASASAILARAKL
uniref:NAD(P)-binding domain-containing protein n=1 Tax=Coccolithus braarudii TaxID=221442 RepID=A0A7S0KYR4_9EUKA|mmetsp:Transcript_10646/g.23136  ORF Transcript_10646/g.23136 Transcript_10646/m.23136 type:complete len:766 (+) Transcript_10646:97-2394(+)